MNRIFSCTWRIHIHARPTKLCADLALSLNETSNQFNAMTLNCLPCQLPVSMKRPFSEWNGRSMVSNVTTCVSCERVHWFMHLGISPRRYPNWIRFSTLQTICQQACGRRNSSCYGVWAQWKVSCALDTIHSPASWPFARASFSLVAVSLNQPVGAIYSRPDGFTLEG